MNKFFECLDEYLSYRANRTELAVVSFIMLLQIFALALWHQMTGELPFSFAINLGLVHWQLPVPVSRTWDLLLGPAFIFLSWAVMQLPTFCERDDFGCLEIGVTNGWGTIMMCSLVVALLVGTVFGAVYAPVGFVVALPAVFILLGVWSFILHFDPC